MRRGTVLVTSWLALASVGSFVSCSKPQAPPPVKHEVELHPVRPPGDQPNANYPATPKHAAKIEENSAGGLDRSIENADLMSAMANFFLEGAHAKTLEEACKDMYFGNKGKNLELVQTEFGDLDGDGQEEAAVTAYSCFAGTGGPDLYAVFRLNPDRKLIRLEFEPQKTAGRFKGKDFKVGLRGKIWVLIENGRLIEELPIFKEGDANCCASGGIRHFIYRWNGHKLALEDVVDLPGQDD